MTPSRQAPRRIALSLEWMDPARGGLERWTWDHARALAASGREVHIVACGKSGELPPGVAFHEAGPAASARARARTIRAVLDTLRCDLVHDMGATIGADILHPHGGSVRAWREHNLMRIPRWRQIRFWREKRYREQEALQREQLAGARTIIAVSEMVRHHLTDFDKVPASRIHVLRNGADCDHFTPLPPTSTKAGLRRKLGLPSDGVLHLMVAHNLRLKNAECTIAALAKVAPPSLLLILGGRKPARQIALARSLGLSERVRFLPPCGDIRPYYQAADTLLHPTWYDPCSLVTLEAMASGLPVVTTRCNGACEILADGIDGFLLPHPSDVNALTERMRALANPVLGREMGIRAREKALTHSTISQTAGFLALYDSLV